MSGAISLPLLRVELVPAASGVRIAIDGRLFGPVLTKRAARVVVRWLEGGALDSLEGRDCGESKMVRALSSVDRAVDDLTDLFRNGLK
jgi:hypothetical protein